MKFLKHICLFVFCTVLCLSCGVEQCKMELSFVSSDTGLETELMAAAGKAERSDSGRFFFKSDGSEDFGGMSVDEIFSGVADADASYCGAALNTLLSEVIGFAQGKDDSRFIIVPALPEDVGSLGVKGLPVGVHVVDIVHKDNRTTEVKNVSGPGHIKCDVCFVGEYPYISMGNTIFTASHAVVDGRRVSKVSVSIPPGSTAHLQAVNQ